MQEKYNREMLKSSYEDVAQRTWQHEDFQAHNLEISRDLFTMESLAKRAPRPKRLEVVALLGGLPFDKDVSDPLCAIQEELSNVIRDALHYWVAPNNLGIEFCVFKWPNEPWHAENQAKIEEAIRSAKATEFRLEIGGVQINPDGCIVARGYDTDGVFFSIRDQMKIKLPFLPKRQSGWAHIPLGRILEPVGTKKFNALREMVEHLANTHIVETTIKSLKLIKEDRWYMEERSLLMDRLLAPVDRVDPEASSLRFKNF